MPGFDDILVPWGGKTYRLKARGPQGRMLAGAKIESVVTLGELSACLARQAVPHVTLCLAYGQLLRHVGATATDDEVMDWLGESEDQEQIGERIGEMLAAILAVLTPGKLPTAKGGAGDPPANPPKPGSSRQRSSSPSAPGG